MKCPLCQVEMRISKSRYVIENDDTPDEETKLFIEQDMTCINKTCANYEKVVDTDKVRIPVG